MKDDQRPPDSVAGPVIAIGSFDGVHLGHQAILAAAREAAGKTEAVSGVLTCDPLPAQVINPDFTFVMTTLDEKIGLLVELGMGFVKVIPFNNATRRIKPDEFIEREILGLSPSMVVVGHDHRFGNKGKGDVELLRRKLEPRGVRVLIIPEFILHDAPVRSTRVRERLLLGDVLRATELLGRNYRLTGPVVSGTGTGKRLGFPTLNISIPEKEKLVPTDGVYAGWAEFGGRKRPAALNIGHRPTFGGETRTIEAHLLDGAPVPTPEQLSLLFVRRLRPERRFPSPAALVEQIKLDITTARQTLDVRAGL